MPSRAARCYRRDKRRTRRRWRLEVIGCQGRTVVGDTMKRGALGSELDGNPAERRAIWSRENTRFLGTVFTLHRLQCGTLVLCVPLYCCNYSNTSYLYNSVFLSRSVLLCMRIPARSLPLISKRCSFREGDLSKLVHCNRCLFG